MSAPGNATPLRTTPRFSGVPEVISLKSEWFLNGKQMPLRSAGMGVGENISPPLSWSGAPAGTVELAIIMEDPDAPLPQPFVHMIAYRISPDKSSVAERALAHEAIGVAFGRSTVWSARVYRTTASPRTRATSLYFPDTRAKPSHRIFICAGTQSVLGWHLGYGNRPGDVGRNI